MGPGDFRWLRSRLARRLALGVSVGFLVLICVAIWRKWGADDLPDIGDPFDVAEALRPVNLPDEQNAYAVYATSYPGRVEFPANWTLTTVNFKGMTWTTAGQAVRAFVDEKRPALEKWRVACERPDALFLQPGQQAKGRPIPLLWHDMWLLSVMAGLEGSRLEDEGAMGQAWDWYRAMLRFSRLGGRHGGIPGVGAQVHEQATIRILHWASDPRVDATQLRKALQDTLAADALTSPLSEVLKCSYLYFVNPDFMRFLRDFGRPVPPLPGGEHGPLDQMASLVGVRVPARVAWLRAGNDVEQAHRALKLLFANWLAQVDRPAAQRAPAAIKDPVWIYADDPPAPPAAHGGSRSPGEGDRTQSLCQDALLSGSPSGFQASRAGLGGEWRARPRAAAAPGADRPPGRRALPPRAGRGPGNGRCLARFLSQGTARGDRGK